MSGYQTAGLRKLTILLTVLILLIVSCSSEPEIDWEEQATEARIVMMANGILSGEPSIEGETVHYGILLIDSRNECLLEGKAVRNPLIEISWTVDTTTREVFGRRIPLDEERRKQMAIVWLYRYIFKETA